MSLEIQTVEEFDKLMQEKITAIEQSSQDIYSDEYHTRCAEALRLMVQYQGRFFASKWLPAYHIAQTEYMRKKC